MPLLGKETFSKYFRTGCKRQLVLNLYPDKAAYKHERTLLNMPDPQKPRPGLEHISQAGEEWEIAKLQDLETVFGQQAIIANRRSGSIGYQSVELKTALNQALANSFIIQGQYEIGQTFKNSLGIADYETAYQLDYAELRPDLIHILPAGSFGQYITPVGLVQSINPGDSRLQLRIIDIKLTSEPSASYFAEVTYYMMALAGWLEDNQLEDLFLVVADGAIWPGSHQASILFNTFSHVRLQNPSSVLSNTDLNNALEQDLIIVPVEVFAIRLRRFLQEEIPSALNDTWQSTDLHIDNRCKGCDNLGYPWLDGKGNPTYLPNHCWQIADQQDDICRVAFLSKGASTSLRNNGLLTVSDLAHCNPTDPVMDSHQILKATRNIIPERANSLINNQANIPQGAGTSGVMPRWADLRIYVSVDYDISSAITLAFGVKAFWITPIRSFQRSNNVWRERSFVIDSKDLITERRELFNFLRHIHQILSWARNADANTTVQLYLWDSLQYKHLTRVIGRHLSDILSSGDVQYLAWLFPPEETVANPLIASHLSPITIVNEVVKNIVAAPVPHYYSLLQTARSYYHPSLPGFVANFNVHPLFEDMLSDQIPSERAYEIWSRVTIGNRYWADQLSILRETVEKRLQALETVVRRLEEDLRPVLGSNAPKINLIGPFSGEHRLSYDGQLWFAYSKLDAALSELEVHNIRAMAPDEREARYHSARLDYRVTGVLESDLLREYQLSRVQNRRVYKLNKNSIQVRFREGDFNCALAPENDYLFLIKSFYSLANGTVIDPGPRGIHIPMERVTTVSIVHIDREKGYIVLDHSDYWATIDDIEANGIASLSTNVILDPIFRDTFTKKLLESLKQLGNPPLAQTNRVTQVQTGIIRNVRRATNSPPAEVIWNGQLLQNTPITRDLVQIQSILDSSGYKLNTSQWNAFSAALSNHLQLIWGPPGTGKSRTVRAIILGAMLEAYLTKKPIRILVTCFTYTALDEVILPVYDFLMNRNIIPIGDFDYHRLRSYYRIPDPQVPIDIDLEINKNMPSQDVINLKSSLEQNSKITLVGSTPEQIHNLMVINGGLAKQELFDLIIIDEASQMDVAHAILPLCSLATNGALIAAGDHLQLPPIHKAEPPLGAEDVVGSIYQFFANIHNINPVMLDENYRSNSSLVEFTTKAGYQNNLHSYSPNIKLKFVSPLPGVKPSNWPPGLLWYPEIPAMLDPEKPAICLEYKDGASSLWNQFEAEVTATIVFLLSQHMDSQLENVRDGSTGQTIPVNNQLYDINGFWKNGIGIVTPHRAQQSLIISQLQKVFPNVQPNLVREAVDTVERFQGQQRDVIIASYALGDPDQIANEDEFLLSLNRFNVMASRARAKLIVLVSQEIADYLSSDIDVLRNSRLLKVYADSFCNKAVPVSLPFNDNGKLINRNGFVKYRE